MTSYSKTLTASVILTNKFNYPGVSAGTKVFYSNGAIPELWTEEKAKRHIVITDTVAGRARLAEIHISNPRNTKESTYTQYKRIKVVDGKTGLTIFKGRIELSNPYYDDTIGQMLKIIARDYSAELFERKVDTNYGWL